AGDSPAPVFALQVDAFDLRGLARRPSARLAISAPWAKPNSKNSTGTQPPFIVHCQRLSANVRPTDIGMLFVRCGNGGISHSPLETATAEDAGIAAQSCVRR